MPSVYILVPFSDAARKWVNTYIHYEDYQSTNSGIAIEHSFIGAIVAGMMEDGLCVDTDFDLVY